MFARLENIRNEKVKLNIDVEAMARGYQEMGELNLQLVNEVYHLETEATYTIENFIGVDKDVD